MDQAMFKTWLRQIQQSPIDDQSLEQYLAIVDKLNQQILDAANVRLRFEDEPAHFQRLLTERSE